MKEFATPRVVVSRCLGFDACRYDGGIVEDSNLARLAPFVQMVPLCPEVAIGLGTPRDPVRIVRGDGADRLFQPLTGRDLTAAMTTFASRALDESEPLDGLVLKSRSPSCGITDTPVWGEGEAAAILERGPGLFGRVARARGIPVIDEGRLGTATLREHFLTAIFALAELRKVKASRSRRRLVEFHGSHQLLLLAHGESELHALDDIVANRDEHPLARVHELYEAGLHRALARPPRCTRVIVVLQRAMGRLARRHIDEHEMHALRDLVQRYRRGSVPPSAPFAALQAIVTRHREPYLARQSILAPFPAALVETAG